MSNAQEKFSREIAKDYDVLWNRDNANHGYKIEEITRLIFQPPLEKKLTILEIGVGTGIHAEYILSHYGSYIEKYVASDFSKEMIAVSKAKLGDKVEYLVTPVETLSYPQVFDVVFMSGTMHHFENPELSFKKINAVLKPGGLMIVCEPNVWNPLNFVRACSTGVDWGQFKVTRRFVSDNMIKNRFTILESKVLHWKGPNTISTTLWPYAKLETISIMNPLAIMFLVAGRKN